ncbi:FAD-binding domain-containing protein [Winogradskyella sp. 3972H.M.0a.05]|uniref:cryptochrome/photolyase family protein n=1 Tax=Winogradskyella sp. 3972H.M.0a.05 TaxID=2950277 RepID=UPI0033968C8F
MTKPTVNIFWFRRDLRLDDNSGFYHALKSKTPTLPIFIFDKNILDKLPKDDARVTFIHESLTQINKTLKTHKSGIRCFYSTPSEVFKELIKNHTVKTVFTNRDYEPYATERDQGIETLLNAHDIDFKTYKDHVIFERDEIVKDDGTPYKVYTPYSRKWLAEFSKKGLEVFQSELHLDNLYKHNTEIPSLTTLGFESSSIKITPFEVNSKLIDAYEATRNFPALDNTSRLGPHLRFGTASTRQMVMMASQRSNNTFLKELIWREFFIQILWHFPHTVDKAFKPQYDRIEWRNAPEDFERWCKGETGFPLVDAGMRQLNETGFMHNRVRMLVGSFLCKHLLIDWRLGEAYFAEKLHDYDMASNVGNWQWVAGCGVDAAPYFRIFNPTTQIQKFDKDLAYIKKWVPEFQELTYPREMVDHKFARERCLKVYKTALD